jgi:hypothetical protein
MSQLAWQIIIIIIIIESKYLKGGELYEKHDMERQAPHVFLCACDLEEVK